jgi:hypothetical protein
MPASPAQLPPIAPAATTNRRTGNPASLGHHGLATLLPGHCHRPDAGDLGHTGQPGRSCRRSRLRRRLTGAPATRRAWATHGLATWLPLTSLGHPRPGHHGYRSASATHGLATGPGYLVDARI